VVIVGGGVSGLAAAWRLKNSGVHDFVVLELEATPGGTAQSGRSDISAYPWGAHYIPVPLAENTTLVSLLRDMGVVEGRDAAGEPVIGEQFLCRDPQERLFYKGRWYEGLYLYAGATDTDLAQFDSFQAEMQRWANWRDAKGRRAFALPMANGSDDAEVTALDRVSTAEWLDRHGYTSPRLRWLVNYACRDDYGATLESTSAWAGLFYHASRVAKSGADAQPLITWPEGNGRIVDYFIGLVRPHVRLGQLVRSIKPTGGESPHGVEVIALDHASETWRGWRADQVIFAAPQFLSPYLIDRGRDVRAFTYSSWLVANLTLGARPESRGFPLAWDNVLYESPSLGYVVSTHQSGIDRGPTIWTYYFPFTADGDREARTRLLGLNWQECADLVLTDLSRAHPEIRSLVTRLDVMRWGHAMVKPAPGFIWGGERAAAAKPDRGIYFAHSDLSGIGLFEEAFYRGVRAADDVVAARRARIS
jgi:hypothetical protein